MSETYNINAHYTNNSKVQRPKIIVNNSPAVLPYNKLYDSEATDKHIKDINNELMQKHKKDEKKELRNFIKGTALFALSILAFLGIKKFFKKS